jgi:hypothetical protein
MAMTTTHVQEPKQDVELNVADLQLALSLAIGSGSVDPDLIAPRDGQEDQQVEDLIAFRCSCL